MKITAIHFRKLSAVTEMKMRTLMSKNFIIMPIFSLGFTFLMKILYRSIADGKINMDGYARRSDEYFHERILYCSRSCGRKRKKYASDTDDFFSKRT